MKLTLRPAVAADAKECWRICYEAFASIAFRRGFPPDFPSVEAAVSAVPGLIEHPKSYSLVDEHNGRNRGKQFPR